MSKILSITVIPTDPRPAKVTALLFGKEWVFEANSLEKVVSKLMERNRFADKSEIEFDLKENFPEAVEEMGKIGK